MARVPGPPPLEGLRRQIERHRRGRPAGEGHFVRETFCLTREEEAAMMVIEVFNESESKRTFIGSLSLSLYHARCDCWASLLDAPLLL